MAAALCAGPSPGVLGGEEQGGPGQVSPFLPQLSIPSSFVTQAGPPGRGWGTPGWGWGAGAVPPLVPAVLPELQVWTSPGRRPAPPPPPGGVLGGRKPCDRPHEVQDPLPRLRGSPSALSRLQGCPSLTRPSRWGWTGLGTVPSPTPSGPGV